MNNRLKRIQNYRRNALTAALAVSMGFTGYAYGQATTGSVFGTAPVSAGETVRVVNNQTGLTREVAVDSAGRYSANQLPTGDYTVSLMQGGNVVASQDHVQVTVSGGTPVPFAAAAGSQNAKNLSTVTVTANSVPAIDVSSTRQTQVMTAQQLKTLPIAHSAEAIALLAPGVNMGGSSLGNGPTGAPLVSMGGNSVVENAYYLNGFNTTDPIGGAGGVSLPYFAISEQQTITSGYGPEYGRSTGGVISQIGQRGSNQWHAGVYVATRPSFAESGYDNIKYANPLTPVGTIGYSQTSTGAIVPGPYMAQNQGTTNYLPGYGQIENGRKQDSDWENVYDAYLSGPLIKDKLFFFITAEWQKDSNDGGLANYGITSPQGFYQTTATSSPKLYGKLDWNINDSNVLELTGARSQQNETSSNFYQYNYTDQQVGNFYAPGTLFKNTYNIGILKYTSYITDNLTLEVMYGLMGADYFSSYAGGNLPPVSFGQGYPTTPPGVTVPAAVDTTLSNPKHTTKTENLRIDLDWKVTDNHDLKFGIDNVQYRDDNDGGQNIGGGTYNYYIGTPASVTPGAPFLNGAGNVPGSYVQYNVVATDVSIASREKAQYVEDKWQVMPNLLLDLGLRNDQFENTGPGGVAYVKENNPQWAPRLGFSWDVFNDSTFKVFGNAGRYYLALPAGLAGRNPQFGSINGSATYTYQSIAANGQPVGLQLVPIAPTPGGPVQGFYSSDGEYGGATGNIKDYASTNLRPQYQDEYVLGFQKQLGDTGLVWGEQATWEKAGNLVDDTNVILVPGSQGSAIPGLVNPGKANYIPQPGNTVVEWNPNTGENIDCNIVSNGAPVSSNNCAFPVPSRKYYALDNYLEHSWDGKWYAKVDYLFSKSYGTTEGPTDTPIGQITNQTNGRASGSTTAQWDFPDIMAWANGEQANSHRHTLKAFGSYAITPEWMVSGTFIVQSGAPNVCLSGYGPEILADIYAGPYQHFCGGTPAGNSPTLVGFGGEASPPGDSGHTPWTHQLNLALTYTPEWANKHLTLQWEIHNVFNEQAATLYYTQYAVGNGGGPAGNNSGTIYWNPVYHTAQSTETPRYMDFNVKFDW
ncbi:TonB-dependent receptor [Dyella mobilis]|uniref:TonB-dependent receptor n=1 Tax=Dyella mobilis TaxID=1849582 RepID=A0ABS2KCL9_9GAMM|nr:TonB-dependent receptor [Dyella mobilis]MBM7128517.1 TonB-dependent receptor [Dyella mobilis]GLQ99580.1 Oar protein [Dyella mobilis]